MTKSKRANDPSKVNSEINWERVYAELASTIQAAKDEQITLISYNSETGEAWRVSPDGKVDPYEIGRDESDWEANTAMTDEEIEAAIAADPDEVSLGDDWMEKGFVVRDSARFVMCVNNKGHASELTVNKVYKIRPDESSEAKGLIRIVDDRGMDSLHEANRFTPVQLNVEAERGFAVEVHA